MGTTDLLPGVVDGIGNGLQWGTLLVAEIALGLLSQRDPEKLVLVQVFTVAVVGHISSFFSLFL